MTEIVRERDVIVLVKGQTFPVLVDPAMSVTGWPGGQGATWKDSPHDTFLITPSDGRYGGFVLWGSNEDSDQLISSVRNQAIYQFATLCVGTWVISTRTFERYTYASRQAGPLVAITYTPGEPLFFSLRGYFTNEDEWTLSADPRAPNTFYVGSVAQAPSVLTKQYLTVHTMF